MDKSADKCEMHVTVTASEGRHCCLCSKTITRGLTYKILGGEYLKKVSPFLSEIGYSLPPPALSYICQKCQTMFKKRLQIEAAYANRTEILASLKKSLVQIKPDDPPNIEVNHCQISSSPVKDDHIQCWVNLASPPDLNLKRDRSRSPTPERHTTKRLKPIPRAPPPKPAKKTHHLRPLLPLLPALQPILITPETQPETPRPEIPILPKPLEKVKTADKATQFRPFTMTAGTSTRATGMIHCKEVYTQTWKGTAGTEKEIKHAKISIKTKTGIRGCHIEDPVYVQLCRSLATYASSPAKVIRILFNSPEHRKEMEKLLTPKTTGETCLISNSCNNSAEEVEHVSMTGDNVDNDK